MSKNEPRPTSAGVSLQAHVEELRSHCEAVSRLQGGSTYLYEEIGLFLDYIGECGLSLDTAPEALSRPPDDEGNEPQVWFLPEEAAVLKATGWKRFSIDGDVAFFAPDQGIAISDTHRGNIILMEDGLLAPIDLRIQLLTGSLIDSVSKLCQT